MGKMILHSRASILASSDEDFVDQKINATLLKELHIYDGIHTLFVNIGWESLLDFDFPTSPLLTRECLSTLSEVNHEGYFIFCCFSNTYQLHVDQICGFFNVLAMNRSTSLVGFHATTF